MADYENLDHDEPDEYLAAFQRLLNAPVTAYVVVIAFMGDDGDQRTYMSGAPGQSSWTSLGLIAQADVVEREKIRRSFYDDD